MLAMLLLAGCHHPHSHRYSPTVVNFQVSYLPALDSQLFPTLLLALANEKINDSLPLFEVSLTAPTDDAVLRVVIDSSNLNYVTIFQETMPNRGERYTFHPSIKWKYAALRSLRQQGGVDFTFTCFVNDEEVDVKNLRLNYRSVNECPLSVRDTSGRTLETRWLFAAYVNEDHPYINHILTSVIDSGIINTFTGYQTGGTKKVNDQVFAIWYYALDRGITYSSISCTSNPSKTSNVQHIRFFDEVYNTRQANCVDACVFFASILRKIGLKPVIFVEPCHAYLGYYTDKNRRNVELLETTITAWVNFPEWERTLDSHGRLSAKNYQQAIKYLSEADKRLYDSGKLSFNELKLRVACNLFEKAKAYDVETYKANKSFFADPSKITYQQVDVELLRQYVQPVSVN